MSIFLISKVRFDKYGEVERVIWAQADGAANVFVENHHEVNVERVVEALDRGDTVEMWFEPNQGWVS